MTKLEKAKAKVKKLKTDLKTADKAVKDAEKAYDKAQELYYKTDEKALDIGQALWDAEIALETLTNVGKVSKYE